MASKQPIQTAAAYIRVSTHRQDELSPDAQKRLLLDYAASHSLSLPEELIFTEYGISGRKAEARPQFLQMIALAKESPPPFSLILLWKFSRFARNQEESIFYKSMLRRKCGIDIVSISEPLMDGPFGSLMERIIEWMDEYYSIRLSGEVLRGMKERAMRGGYQSSPPLGYRIPYPKAPMEIVPEQADIIRTIFNLYTARRLSPSEIARILNHLGLRTKNGNPFDRRSIGYILDNPVYVGKIRWNVRSGNQSNPPSQWIIVQGSHPSIIDQDTYEAAAALRMRSASPGTAFVPAPERPSNTDRPQYSHWLSGFLKCSSCGRTLILTGTRSRKTGKHYNSFQCWGYMKGKCSVSHSISAAKAEQSLLLALDASCCDSCAYRPAQHTPPSPTSPLSPAPAPCPSADLAVLIQRRLKSLEQREHRLLLAYEEGVDSLEEYRHKKEQLAAARQSVCSSARQLETPLSSLYDQRPLTSQPPMTVRQFLLSEAVPSSVKHAALGHILQKAVFYSGTKQIVFYFRSPRPHG